MGVAAVILCGGGSRRMGHSKAALKFGPESLLDRVVRLASTVAGPVVIVGAADQELPAPADSVIVVRDSVKGKGPLQGLADGLSVLPPDVTLAYVTAVDVPLLEPAWVELLADRIGEHELALPCAEGRLHPLSALYRVAPALVAIRRMLAQDELRVTRIAENVRTLIIAAELLRTVDPELRTLKNLNTPDAYQEALVKAGFAACGESESGG